MEEISGQNFLVWVFAQYRKNGQKFSKKRRTRLQRPSCPNPSRFILVSWFPIYDQNINSKAIGQLVSLPRQCTHTVTMYERVEEIV
jgi:hypothetical protein